MNKFFTISLIFIVLIIGNISGCSVGVSKFNIRHDFTDTSEIQLNKLRVDNFDSYYTIVNGKFYSRIYYREPMSSYNFVVYFVADIKNGRLINPNAYVVDAIIHPFVFGYPATTEVAKFHKNDNSSYLSLKLIANNIFKYRLKSVAIMFDHVPLKYLKTLNDLKSRDNSWLFAKNLRKIHFNVY